MKSKIKNKMCNDLLNCFRKDYSRYENQISFGEIDYNQIDNLHNFLKLFRPDAHCVIGDDTIMGFLLIYMTFSPLKGMNDVFKINIQKQDPSLNISFKKNYYDATTWINNLLINKNVITDILAKRGLINKIKCDLPKDKLICCLTIRMPMDDLLQNCVELLRYQ
jgi:hypothetical protein